MILMRHAPLVTVMTVKVMVILSWTIASKVRLRSILDVGVVCCNLTMRMSSTRWIRYSEDSVFSIVLHSHNTTDDMKWASYPGYKVDIAKDLTYLKIHGRNIKQDSWEMSLDTNFYPPLTTTLTLGFEYGRHTGLQRNLETRHSTKMIVYWYMLVNK